MYIYLFLVLWFHLNINFPQIPIPFFGKHSHFGDKIFFDLKLPPNLYESFFSTEQRP